MQSVRPRVGISSWGGSLALINEGNVVLGEIVSGREDFGVHAFFLKKFCVCGSSLKLNEGQCLAEVGVGAAGGPDSELNRFWTNMFPPVLEVGCSGSHFVYYWQQSVNRASPAAAMRGWEIGVLDPTWFACA